MLDLKIIVGSTRRPRAADLVLPWLTDRATSFGAFAVDVLDLREWALPMFAEGMHTIGDSNDPAYSASMVKDWNRVIGQADAFVVVTAEYNHSIPAALKNAIDSVFASYALRNKPAAIVAYSAGGVGGARAVEHLAHVLLEAETVPLRNTVLIPHVATAFDPSEAPTDACTESALRTMLEDLAWWAELLHAARDKGALPPARQRIGIAAGAGS